MKTIQLIGHSGCPLILQDNNNRLEVIKISKNIEYNNRLKAQYEKQQSFSHELFYVPAIFDSKINTDGLFQFNMEYVSGVRLADKFHTIAISSLPDIADIFEKLIPNKQIFDPKAKEIFQDKINNLKKSIEVENPVIAEAIIILESYDWKYCMNTTCHGDLTLENIIVSNEKYYLIDFLDSFYDSWMMDFAKLFQDCECFWSYRHSTKEDVNLDIRLSIFKQLLSESILSLPDGKEIFKTIYYILLMNLVRIVPYSKDQETNVFLDKSIQKVINKIKLIS